VLTYPINLVGLANRLCLIVGGGPVAFRKAEGLLEAGAIPRVVAPQVVGELAALATRGAIRLELRPFEVPDLDGAFLVIAATDDPALNRAVSEEAQARGALVNVVDVPEESSFIVPAVVRRGAMNIAVSTGGASPALARRLREQLDAQFGPEYKQLVDLLAELRPGLVARYSPGKPRLEAALRLVDAGLHRTIAERGLEAAREQARSLLGID
jgi:precorrin-2 dehydrogenase / sirohydrochlorin ferrochelatase